MGQMDKLAGITREAKVSLAKPKPLMYRIGTAAAMYSMSIEQFRLLDRAGLVPHTVVPGGRGKRPIRRWTDENLAEGIRRMTDDSSPKGGQ